MSPKTIDVGAKESRKTEKGAKKDQRKQGSSAKSEEDDIFVRLFDFSGHLDSFVLFRLPYFFLRPSSLFLSSFFFLFLLSFFLSFFPDRFGHPPPPEPDAWGFEEGCETPSQEGENAAG